MFPLEDPAELGRLCSSNHALAVVFLLFVTAAAKAVLTAVTFGIAVPAGIFMPTIAVSRILLCARPR